MKGLILNNFYSMEDNIKLSFTLSILISSVSLIISDTKIISILVAAQIFIVLGNISSSLQMDEKSKWNKMEITMPVKRKTIIEAKYISFLLLIVLGSLFSLMTITVSLIRQIGLSGTEILNGYSFGLSLSLSTIAILYPVILKFGSNKSESVFILASVLSIVIRFLVWKGLRLVINDVNFNGIEVGISNMLVSIIMFFISYFISVKVHTIKNFN